MVHHQGIFEWVELFVKTTNLSGMLTFDFIVNEADQEFCTGCSLKLNPAFSIFTDETQVHMHIKGGPGEEKLVYMFSTFSKFEFSHQITEHQAFVLVFARKTTEFLTAKHWLS